MGMTMANDTLLKANTSLLKVSFDTFSRRESIGSEVLIMASTKNIDRIINLTAA
jgi:hypothetical protein